MNRTKTVAVELLRIGAPLLILLLGIGGFLLFGRPPERQRVDAAAHKTALVRTAPVVKFDDSFTIEVEGAATPYRRVTLSAEVAGRIVHKAQNARAGGYVHQGDVLFQIDPTDYDLEIERLDAQLAQANAEIDEVDVEMANTQSLIALAEEDVRLQQRNLARSQRLSRGNTVSDTELDQARIAELAARNSLKTLQNQLASLEKRKSRLAVAVQLANVQLKQARVKKQRTIIKAPINGTVVTDEVEENDYVTMGTPLIHFTESDKIEVKCSLRVEELYWVWLQSELFGDPRQAVEARYKIPPTPVKVVFEFQDVEYLWDGVLSRYEGTGLDEQTRMIPCRVLVKEPTKVRMKSPAGNSTGNPLVSAGTVTIPSLYSGMYVTVRFEVKPPIPLLKIPLSALQPRGQVWVVREEKLRILPAKVARVNDDYVLIRALSPSSPSPLSLQEGDKVVVSPLAAVEDGMSVEIAVQEESNR